MEIVHATLLNTADPIRHRSKQRGDGRGTRDSLRHKEKGQICRLAQEHKCKQTTENYYEPYSRPFRSHGDKIIIKNISISKETIISCYLSKDLKPPAGNYCTWIEHHRKLLRL